MSGRLALADQVRQRAIKEAKRHQTGQRAIVVKVRPLTVEPFDYAQQLVVNEDFYLSQWAKWYHQRVGIRRDDVVMMHHDDEWVLLDIISDAPLGPLGA
jgi:hypothetical protein